jgi:UDPglucose--hexose-1-phosphate uridylyltransferase
VGRFVFVPAKIGYVYCLDEAVPELRTDWLTGRTVIIAEERAARPNDFSESTIGKVTARGIRDAISSCPFCPGQEHRTPTAVHELPDGSSGWRVRVVPNRFPAVRLPAGEYAATEATSEAIGAHEVIIETARHETRTSALRVDELRVVLDTYALRLRQWRADGRWRYGLVFKNQGPRAGASLAHVHSQLVALPGVPPTVATELQRATDDFAARQKCPYCRLIQQEHSFEERIVLDQDGFIAFCPPASWQPFETWLLPHKHEPAFEHLAAAIQLEHLAGVLHKLIGRIESVVPEASYNLILRTAPWVEGNEGWCHWRIELLPRLAAFAGLELAAGIHINPLSPERAAGYLRM